MLAHLTNSPGRTAALRAARDGAFEADVPDSLDFVSIGVAACRRCALSRGATQGVSGEGPVDAHVMLVGEQPGEREDLEGRPFVGPSGSILDEALAAARIPRNRLYLTNAVKHFKFEQRGARRIRETPIRTEVELCRWWLDSERRLVRPRVIVALGSTAVLSVFGKPLPIMLHRGEGIELPGHTVGVVTFHPSYLFRMKDDRSRARAFADFVDDLAFAWSLSRQPRSTKS